MAHQHDIKPEDSDLFRNSVGPVTPLRRPRTVIRSPQPPPHPQRRQQARDELLKEMASGEIDLTEIETGEELSYRHPGVQTQVFKRLRRGHFVVEAELDLHGMTSDEAKISLVEFLHACRRANRRCVRIVHGKGKGSRDGRPVLKSKLNHWLRIRDEVLAFCSARLKDGGTGAVYVLLRQRR